MKMVTRIEQVQETNTYCDMCSTLMGSDLDLRDRKCSICGTDVCLNCSVHVRYDKQGLSGGRLCFDCIKVKGLDGITKNIEMWAELMHTELPERFFKQGKKVK